MIVSSDANIFAADTVFKLDFYDIIVSNPPYVSYSDKSTIANNVLNYEPHLAIFVPDSDALKFYNTITDIASKRLRSGGLLYFEINEHKAPEVISILKDKGFTSIELKKDLQGKDRMVKAVWKL